MLAPVSWLPDILWTLHNVRGSWDNPVEHLPAPLCKEFIGGIVGGVHISKDFSEVYISTLSPAPDSGLAQNGLVSVAMSIKVQSPMYSTVKIERDEAVLLIPDDAHGITYELVTSGSIINACMSGHRVSANMLGTGGNP